MVTVGVPGMLRNAQRPPTHTSGALNAPSVFPHCHYTEHYAVAAAAVAAEQRGTLAAEAAAAVST